MNLFEQYEKAYGMLSSAHLFEIKETLRKYNANGEAEKFWSIAEKLLKVSNPKYRPNPVTLTQKVCAEMNINKDRVDFVPEKGIDNLLYTFHKKYEWEEFYSSMRDAWRERYKSADIGVLREALQAWNCDRIDDKPPYPKSVSEYYKQLIVRKCTQERLEEKPTNYMKQAINGADGFDPSKASDEAVKKYGYIIQKIRETRPKTGAYDENGVLRHANDSPLAMLANATLQEYKRRFPNAV